MPTASKSADIIRMEGKSHRTKKELRQREQAEKALLTGIPLKERQEVKDNEIAHKEFLRLKKLLEKINKFDDMYGAVINRYCILYAETKEFEEKRDQFYKQLCEFQNEKDDMLINRELTRKEYYGIEASIPYVEKGITVIDSLVDHWNELDPATQKTIVKFAAIAAATGPVLLGAGKVSTGIGGMITNFGKVSGAIMRLTNGAGGFKVLGAVMTGPAGIAIVAIAAGALLIYKNWDKISPLLGKTAARFESFWNTVQPQLQPFLGLCTEIGSYLKSGFIKAVQFVFSEGSDVIVIFFEGASQYIDGFLGVLEGVTTFMNGVFTGNWEKAWKGLRDIVSNSFGMLEAFVKTPMNAVISIVNGAISRINSIHFTVPDWVLGIGGKSWKGLNIPQIPTLSKGTDNWQGGIVQISEKGGEIVDLPRGTRVYPHDESVRMARSENKGTVITIAKLADSIIVREEADIDRIAERIVQKVKETNDNLPQTAVA